MRSVALLFSAALLISCGRGERPPVQDLTGAGDVSAYRLTDLRGTRDGATLGAAATYTNLNSSTIQVSLRFAIGSPTTLTSGTWSANGETGTVSARSITFLGGQASNPSLGGTFDLLQKDGAARYRVRFPTTELHRRL